MCDLPLPASKGEACAQNAMYAGGARPSARPLARGFSTKIHLKADFGGVPLAFDLTGDEAGDSGHFETLVAQPPQTA